ncbi:MAG: nucleotidyl transferase AbiEii/AbiGii toxin family protein [Clostridiales bacterium]|nr:nucleotidyl transferase AbiEii/AbiGii toxin family protein [Clostridiales bacterium]
MKNLKRLKAYIKNKSEETGINPQILFRIYMIERLIERISVSEYKNSIIIKGGVLVASMVGVNLRSTIDIDTTIKTYPVNEQSIKRLFDEILNISINDGISFEYKKIEIIRAEDEYEGYRISLNALMENAKIPIKVDITTGDVITPREIVYKYNLLFEDRCIEILSYNIETILAEKLETLLSRGIVNTRMRDFYDLYILLKLKGNIIDWSILKEAIIATSRKRGSQKVIIDGKLTITEIFTNQTMRDQWVRYQQKYLYAKAINWEEINEAISIYWDNIKLLKY